MTTTFFAENKPLPAGRLNRAWRIPGFLIAAVMTVMAIMAFPLKGSAESEPVTLSLALYPYVPDQGRFVRAVESLWYQEHPDVKLNFVTWDCYAGDPGDELDVFVYDSIFLYDFLEQGYLLPLEDEDIRDAGDLIPSALSACRAEGTLYAVPQFLCTNLLFGRENDGEILNVQNISELYEVVGVSTDQAIPPVSDHSLLVRIPDPLEFLFWYLETQIDLDQEFSEWMAMPDADSLDPEILETLTEVQAMAGSRQMKYEPPNGDIYIRGKWFADGLGRAMIGFSESMYAMGSAAEDVTFHRISLSDAEDIPMFYADLASINAKIDESKKPLAVELLNLITGPEVMTQAIAPSKESQNPQYLFSARMSVYDALSTDYPVYEKMKEIAADPESRVFIIQPSGRALVSEAARAFEKE